MPINGHKLEKTSRKGPACHAPGQERKAAGVTEEEGCQFATAAQDRGAVAGYSGWSRTIVIAPNIIVQIASAQEALRGVGRALMKNHLQHCTTQAVAKGPEQAAAMYDELLELIYKHLR